MKKGFGFHWLNELGVEGMGSAVFGPYFPIFLFFFFLLSIFSLLLFFFSLTSSFFTSLYSLVLYRTLCSILYFSHSVSSFPTHWQWLCSGHVQFSAQDGEWVGWLKIHWLSVRAAREQRSGEVHRNSASNNKRGGGGGSFVRPLNLDLFCFPVLVCSGCVLVKEVVHGDGTRVASWRGSEWPFYTEPLPREGCHCLAVLGHDRIGEVDQASQQRVIRSGDPVGLWGVGVGRDAKGQWVFAKPDIPKLWCIFLIVSNGIWEKLANVSFDLVRRIYAGDLASPLPVPVQFPRLRLSIFPAQCCRSRFHLGRPRRWSRSQQG